MVIFLQILITFVPLKTGMNTLPSRNKLYHFNVTMSSLYVIKLKIAQKQLTATAVRSVQPIVSKLSHKVVQCSFSPVC